MIQLSSSTRVDISGGTLDMWPLHTFVGQCITINVAIDVQTYVDLQPESHSKISIHSRDYNQNWSFDSIQCFLKDNTPQLQLYRCAVQFFKDSGVQVETYGFSLSTASESPIGGGLGGSSSLMISLLKGFSHMYEYTFKDVHHMVHCAHNIEAAILMTPTGTQDYYPAVTDGLSVLTYSSCGIQQEVLDVSGSPMDSHFLLVYTGKSHHSGLNNFEVLKACVEKNEKVLSALKKINEISYKMLEVIRSRDWEKVPDLFQQEYAARIQLTPAFTSPEIEHLSKLVLANGADGVKICGAGGGGCVLVWVKPENRQKVIEACEKEKFQCLKSKIVKPKNHQQKFLKL